MAGGTVKGITISFAGDTTKLDKALRQINKETRDIDKELKQVDKALKFNPTSVELWRQKQQLLTQKVEETKRKLDALKQAQAKMDAEGVDKNSKEYRELQREIIATESKVKTFEGQLKKVGNVNLRAASEQVKQLGNKLTAAGEAMRGISTAAAAVTAAIGALTIKSGKWADDINTMSKVYGIGTGELQKYSAAADLVDVSVEDIAKTHLRLTKAMSGSEDETGAQAEAFAKLGIATKDADGNLRDADTVWQETIAALGEMENETERDALAMTLMGKSAANLNPLIEDGGDTYKRVADTLKKYDLDFVDQDMLDNANEFNDSIDTIKTLGLVAFQQLGTKLAAYLAPALEKVVDLVGRLAGWFANLSPKTQAIIAGIAAVLAVTAPLLLGLGKIAFAISSIMGLVSTIGPAIGGVVSAMGPVVIAIAAVVAVGVLLYKNWDKIKAKAIELKTKVVAAFTQFKTKVSSIFTGIKDAISNAWRTAKAFVFAIVKNIVLKVTSSFNSLKTRVSSIFTAIKTTASTIWSNIKSAISNAISNAVSNVKTKISSLKSSISAAWSAIKESTAKWWNSIKEKITGPFESAKEKISGIIDTIKGWFPISIGKIFKNLSLPHFSLDWATKDFGKLGSIKYPTGLNVSWYAQGGIFDSPSVIGVGEAGPEAVVPLDKFWDKLDKMQGGETNIVININGSNKDPREIAEEVKRVLIKETNNRRLAWQ